MNGLPPGSKRRHPRRSTHGHPLGCGFHKRLQECRFSCARSSRDEYVVKGVFHPIEDIVLLMAGCTTLERSIAAAINAAREYLRVWANELLESESDYGQRAYACLEGNWPRAVEIEEMDRLLEILATVRWK